MNLVEAKARSFGVCWDRARSLDFIPSTRRSDSKLLRKEQVVQFMLLKGNIGFYMGKRLKTDKIEQKDHGEGYC